MNKTLIAALMMLSATFVYAQDDIDFSMLNVRSNVAAQPVVATAAGAPITAPPTGTTGQGAPYYYGNTGYQTSWYAQPSYQNTDVIYRYQSVKQALDQYAGYYGLFSRERRYYKDAAAQGENLYVRYLQYRDSYSAAALQQWCQQWEYQFGYSNNGGYNNGGWNQGGGWNSGYYCTCYTDRWGHTIRSSCQLHYAYAQQTTQYYNCGCYLDQWGRQVTRSCRSHGYYYPQGSYGYNYYSPSVNNPFINGLQIGNGVGNIVQGNQQHNGLQTAGGVLSTVGGILGIIDSARR